MSPSTLIQTRSSRLPVPEERRARIRASALWAAYGDALGFITELATTTTVRQRAGTFPIWKPIPWRRRIGGRGGPTVELPAGCTSDDTQLRLSVSRCMGPGGFDPDAFAKVELTVWPAYALGAGRGSKIAATNLARRDVSWSTNFFENDRASYVDGGGNGAAMRIQPHVWAAGRDATLEQLLAEVYTDSIVTHGHPRALLGAGIHALSLRHALQGSIPGPDTWAHLLDQLRVSGEVISSHRELGGLWSGMWRARSGVELGRAIEETIEEISYDVRLLSTLDDASVESAYQSAVELIEARSPEQRGSGSKTALLASWLAWRTEGDAEAAVVIAANQLGTDTDSIATMAGAIIGAAIGSEPPHPVADRQYITSEADRMWALAHGQETERFPHPDLRRWQPPRSQSDALVMSRHEYQLCGLGPLVPASDKVGATSGKNAASWQWFDLWFGQRVLVKRRARPPALPASSVVRPVQAYSTPTLLDVAQYDITGSGAEDRELVATSDSTRPPRARSLHELTDEAISGGFDARVIGSHLLELSQRDDGIEKASMYAAVIAKARLSRRDRDRRVGDD